MTKIICFINLFTSNARVYSFNEEINNQTFICEVPVETLSEGLASVSSMNNINTITLIGAPMFAKEIAPEIMEYAKTNFNNNDLIVEVME